MSHIARRDGAEVVAMRSRAQNGNSFSIFKFDL